MTNDVEELPIEDIPSFERQPDTAPAGMEQVTKAPRKSSSDKMVEQVESIYVSASLLFAMFSPGDAAVIAGSANACAKAWVALADQEPAVKRFLKRLVTGSAYTGIISTHLGIVIGLMAVRGMTIQDMFANLSGRRSKPVQRGEFPQATPFTAPTAESYEGDAPPAPMASNPGLIGLTDIAR